MRFWQQFVKIMTLRLRVGLILSLFAPTFLSAKEIEPQRFTLGELDAIVSQGGSLDGFLGRADLVEAYYHAAASYYGEEKFSKESFDAIILQLKGILQRVPELKKRLWETPTTSDLGPTVRIQSSARSYGRLLETNKWDIWVQQASKRFKQAVSARFPNGISDFSKADEIDLLTQVQSKMDEEVHRLRSSSSYLSANSARKRHLDGELMKEFKKDESVKRAADYFTWKIFGSEEVVDLLRSNDADLVLETIGKLSSDPALFLRSEAKMPGLILSEIKQRLPSLDQTISDESIFPRKMIKTNQGKLVSEGMSVGEFVFKPIPRRIHGIFRGIPLRECIGGNCHSLDHLTPERWATVAISNSHLQYLEVNGHYGGFVEAAPGEINRKKYGSVSFGAPDLRKTVLVKDPQTGKSQRSTLYDEWLLKSEKLKPKEWEGFVVSSDTAINNAGVKNLVFKSPSYLGGPVLSKGKDFQLLDPIIPEIISNSSKGSALYIGSMVLDATVSTAAESDLHFLQPLFLKQINDPSFVRVILLGKDSELRPSLLRFLQESKEHMSAPVWNVLREAAATGPADASEIIFQMMLDKVDPYLADPNNLSTIKERAEREIKIYLARPPMPEGKDTLPSPLLAKLVNEAKRSSGEEITKILIELNQKYPSVHLLHFLLDTDNLKPAYLKAILPIIEENPQLITAKRLGKIAKGLAESGMDSKDPFRWFHTMSEKLLNESTPYATQAEFIRGWLMGLNDLTNPSGRYRDRVYVNHSLSRIARWIENHGDLTLTQFSEIHNMLKHIQPNRFQLFLSSEQFPKNIGKFMLDPDPKIRAAALSLKQTLAKEILPSAWAGQELPSRSIIEAIVERDYEKLAALAKYEDRWRNLTFEYALNEVLKLSTIDDPEFFKAIAEFLSSQNETKRMLGNDIITQLIGSRTLSLGEPIFREIIESSVDESQKQALAHALNAHHNGVTVRKKKYKELQAAREKEPITMKIEKPTPAVQVPKKIWIRCIMNRLLNQLSLH